MTPEAVGIDIRSLLERAVESLRDGFPETPGRLSSLDVLERHLICGYSWDAITTECLEKGAPVSERTLRMRQRDGLEIVLQWSREQSPKHLSRSVSEPEMGARGRHDSTNGDDPAISGRSVLRVPNFEARIRRGAVATVFCVIAGWIAVATWESRSGTHITTRVDLDALPLGQEIPLGNGFRTLPEPYPPWRLPQLDSEFDRAILVEPAHGELRVLLAAAISGDDAGELVLWDPFVEEIVWRDRLRPSSEEMRRSFDVSDRSVARELYRPTHLVYGTRAMNLLDSVVVVFVQRHSPSFVVEYGLDNGERLGQYDHFGRLETQLVADLDGDARPEVLLGGQDDRMRVPTLVMLRPGQLRGAASTSSSRRGSEGACVRVFLPALRELESLWETDRLQVANGIAHRWDPELGILSFDVGATNETIAYRVSLDRTLRPIPGATLNVGGAPARAWRAAGLNPDRAEDFAGRIRVIRGGGCGDDAR